MTSGGEDGACRRGELSNAFGGEFVVGQDV